MDTYIGEVLGRVEVSQAPNPEEELYQAFGVGSGSLIKVNSTGTLHFYYVDTTTYNLATQWLLAKRTSLGLDDSSLAAMSTQNPSWLTNESSAQLTSNDYCGGAPRVIYDGSSDEQRFYMYRHNTAPNGGRDRVCRYRSTSSDGVVFSDSGAGFGEIATGGGYKNTAAGVYADQYGGMSSQYGWYVYTGHSPNSCTPSSSSNDCGMQSVAVTSFRFPWQSGRSYVSGAWVVYAGYLYAALVAHTANSSNAPGTSYWQLLN